MGFKGEGADVAKTGVQSGAVVEALDVVEERGAGLGPGGKLAVIDGLVFETAPERLDVGVVVAIALAAHGGEQAVFGEHLTISGTGKLHSPIRVHDQPRRRLPPAERHPQRGNGHGRIQNRAHGPAQHPARVSIQHRDDIKPALPREGVRRKGSGLNNCD